MELWDTTSGQRRIRLFDDWISKRGSPFETILLSGFNQFRGCGLSANGRRALVATVDGTLHVWDLPSDTKGVRSLHGFEFRLSKVSHCALSADGRVLVAVSEEGKLRCWDVESLKMRFESQPGKVNDCALSTNGELMLAACADGTLQLCDTARGHEIAHWTHDVALQCCALSANGRILVAGDIEGGVHILDVVGVG